MKIRPETLPVDAVMISTLVVFPTLHRLAQPSKAARHAVHVTGWLAWWHRLIVMAQRTDAKRTQGAGFAEFSPDRGFARLSRVR